MPWEPIKLNSGYSMPSIAFGTGQLGNGDDSICQVDQAISVGFNHFDTAQSYRNETEAGVAIRESSLARNEIFITTKYSGTDGLDIKTSIQNSLKNLGVTYVDLYLIHHPRLAVPDIPTVWKEMEALQAKGLAKSIGVSNFGVHEIALLLASSNIKPAANQILLHPYVYARQSPIVEYCQKAGIVIEAYSPLMHVFPLTTLPGGPVDDPVNDLAAKYGVTPDQILLAWTKSKGAVVVTTSSKKSRLEGYLSAGDLELSPEEVTAIDLAGAAMPRHLKITRRVAVTCLASAVAWGILRMLGY
ncbi:Aldo/keto reductase [Guyanagaster necrorhizus]|uniref:Aldo/keto reductase n=1 Tax=Guyanagaster necrorhizus TaxID=856835 RepID=A0A9P8AM16_9AGAR|nr:Aldo/keto reductase [Guyanagaster necrorhizus MCA 3950]KAG7440808.1 Aldo/keto reductase [Guyanagaster necrorhizus MCA 3950]